MSTPGPTQAEWDHLVNDHAALLARAETLANQRAQLLTALEVCVAIIEKQAPNFDTSGMGGDLWIHAFGDAKLTLRQIKKHV